MTRAIASSDKIGISDLDLSFAHHMTSPTLDTTNLSPLATMPGNTQKRMQHRQVRQPHVTELNRRTILDLFGLLGCDSHQLQLELDVNGENTP